MSIQIFDCIVIGGGGAGCSAAIYVSQANKKVLMIVGESGGQIATANIVNNYLGFQNISGSDLGDKLTDHAKSVIGEQNYISSYVKVIFKRDNIFIIKTVDDSEYYTKTIIIATGSSHRHLDKDVPKNLICYCAICDGFLYKNKEVVVIGGGNSAFEAVKYLSGICKKVTLVHRSKNFRAFANLIEYVKSLDNVAIITDEEVQNIQLRSDNIINVYFKNTMLEVDGIFVNIGMIPNTQFLKGENQINLQDVQVNASGHIIVDKKGKTTCNGIFAAGDVTNQNDIHQLITASGEGTNAALSVIEWLSLN